MESIDRRLDELERQNAALKAENNAIKSKLIEIESGGVRKRIVPPLPLERGVTITTQATDQDSPVKIYGGYR
jgi:hypothetical protein